MKMLCHLLSMFSPFFITCLSLHISTSIFCGKIPIQTPFLSSNASVGSSPLTQMILCRSQKLYFRTSLGLFPVSSIDYTTKTLIISHSSSSSSHHFVSPSLLSAGFPSPSKLNSLLIFNCSRKNYQTTSLFSDCTRFKAYSSSPSKSHHQQLQLSSSCFLVDDIEKLDKGFHPNDLNCSRYRRVHRSLNYDDENSVEYELGTRISFDIPDHVPKICDQCEKPNGNCGVGLRCICHPKDCKDKVISKAGSVEPFGGNAIFILISIVILVSFVNVQPLT